MTKQFTFFIVSAVISALTIFSACKKDSPAANLAYVGTYFGAIDIDPGQGGTSSADTLKVAAGSNATQITVFDQADSVTYTGTVSGNNITSISGTIAASGGSSAENLTGTGTLNGNTIAFTVKGSYTYSGTTYTDTLFYTAVKH